MLINTIPGKIYAISTASGNCTVTATVPKRGVYTLAYIPFPGQAAIQAPSDLLSVSDDSAVVTSFNETNLLAAHAANQAIHITSEEKASIYQDNIIAAPQGSDNAHFNYFELSPRFLGSVSGFLTSISIKGRTGTDTTMTTEPRFIGLFEESGYDINDYIKIGASTNAATQAIGATCTWTFDRIPLSGRALRLVLLADPADDWNTDSHFAARVKATTDGSYVVNNGSKASHIPDITLHVSTLDYGRKLTPNEHDLLSYLLENRTKLQQLIES